MKATTVSADAESTMPFGTVADFDDAKGYGHVLGADGVARFFHCTVIADGTRSIEVGAAVTYHVVPGHSGQWEAADVRPATADNQHAPPTRAMKAAT